MVILLIGLRKYINFLWIRFDVFLILFSIKDGLDKCKRSLRLEPVGLDRHFKLYWVFSNGMPGIYVEDGWMYDAGEKRTIDR